MIDRSHSRRRHAARVASLALTFAASLAACERASDGGDAHHDHGAGDGHDHDHEEHATERAGPKTDAHHAAQGHAECEDDVALSLDAIERHGIEVAPAREMMLSPLIPAPGHLALPQDAIARVGCAVSGRVAEIRVRTGDLVAKGDALLVIESAELGAAQSDYLRKGTLAAAGDRTVELARSAFERAQALFERVEGVALAEVQRREAELRALERDLDLARADAEAARNALLLLGMDAKGLAALDETRAIDPRLSIGAPIGGRVLDLDVTLGELVDATKDRLIVIGDLTVLWAIAEVSESRVAEVAIGAEASVKVPAAGNAMHAGTVAAIAPMLEASTRTAEVRVALQNANGALLPGMFIHVEIESTRGGDAPRLAVPDGAVLTIEGKPSVFVPLEPGASVFCKHAVEVGAPIGEHVPILAGLRPGDLVVVAGAFLLKAEHGKSSAQHDH